MRTFCSMLKLHVTCRKFLTENAFLFGCFLSRSTLFLFAYVLVAEKATEATIEKATVRNTKRLRVYSIQFRIASVQKPDISDVSSKFTKKIVLRMCSVALRSLVSASTYTNSITRVAIHLPLNQLDIARVLRAQCSTSSQSPSTLDCLVHAPFQADQHSESFESAPRSYVGPSPDSM